MFSYCAVKCLHENCPLCCRIRACRSSWTTSSTNLTYVTTWSTVTCLILIAGAPPDVIISVPHKVGPRKVSDRFQIHCRRTLYGHFLAFQLFLWYLHKCWCSALGAYHFPCLRIYTWKEDHHSTIHTYPCSMVHFCFLRDVEPRRTKD